MACPACGAVNRAGIKFCEECGAPLQLRCPSCGASLPPDKKFCGECGATLAAAPPRAPAPVFASPQSYTPAHLAERILKDRAALAGERKQVTVLFADVSGFTSISEKLDPEDVHALINRAFELMLAEIHRYEGTVNQFLGDGLMALFGAPLALEDHARRAAYAALGMQRVLATYADELRRTRGIEFAMRMGLNTGLVVVGAIGDNLRMDYTAVGDATNTAARMQQIAEPGQVVVAEATERLIGPYFEMRALGERQLKNRAQAVAAFELRSAHAGVSRLLARGADLSPLVARDDALATLDRALTAARGGRGQAVFLVGDPGMGKSRLLLEFHHRLGESARWLEGNCSSFGASTPYLPIIGLLKTHLAIEDGDDEAAIVAKVQRGLAFLGAEAASVEAPLRYLLSVDPGDPALAKMDATQRRARIVTALQRVLAAESRQRPLVVVIEDAHWMDLASEDWVKAFVEMLPGIAVLLVVSYRPTYQHPFGDRTYYWRIALQPVDADSALRIVRATLGVADVPPEIADVIARKAEGNPFFLEEIGRTLTETGALRVTGGRVVATGPPAALAVPDTVQDVIAARIDRLEESQKRTVQTASVIGREFALSLLRRVSEVEERLESSLTELKRIELIYERAGWGDSEYVFRHALTQDVAYAGLLQAERRRLHARIAAAMEEVYAGRLEEHVEKLVHHFAHGEVWDKVVRYAGDAAEKAAGLCVDSKALEFYELALDALRHLPEDAETARVGIDLRLAMRAPLWRSGRPEPLYALFKEAEDLATRFGHTDRLDTVYAFLVQYYWARGEHDQALEYGRRCLERAEARGDLGLRITGLFYTGHTLHALGRYAESVKTYHEVLALLEGPRVTERFGLSGLPYPCACAQAAEALSELGDYAGALALFDRGDGVANAAEHLYTKMVLAGFRGAVLAKTGRLADAIAVLEPAVVICREKNFYGQLINTLRHLAAAYVASGRAREGLPLIHESIEMQERASVSVVRGSQWTTVALAHLELGELDQAEQAITTALDFCERQAERGYEGWARCVAGEIAVRRGDRATAMQFLDEAQNIAEELAMRPLLERCRAAIKPVA